MNFVGWKSQTIAHTYYPTTYVHNGKEKPLKKGENTSHDIIMNHAMQFIESNAKKQKKPFFLLHPNSRSPRCHAMRPKKLHSKWRKENTRSLIRLLGNTGSHGGDGIENSFLRWLIPLQDLEP